MKKLVSPAVLVGSIGIMIVLFSLSSPQLEGVRAARMQADAVIDPEVCWAGVVHFEDAIMCLTDAAEVEGEITNIPPGQQRDMIVCDVEVPEDSGNWTTEVRYHPSQTGRPPRCELVCPDMLWPGIAMANVETGVEACLRAACDPCPITGSSWGQCPSCLTDRTPSCAVACPEPEPEDP